MRRLPGALPALAASLLCLAGATVAGAAGAQEPPSEDPVFHTFSIVAVDRATGETGVAVTTRNDCVGNRVPHARAGVGAVATQAWTRYEYGPELLDLLEAGRAPEAALREALAEDTLAHRRQVGVIDARGRTAHHTGAETPHWSGHRSGTDFTAQGNVLAGPQVLDAVARSFEETRGSKRALADRLVAALEAGQAAGGDARSGRIQSAAVLVADPREGASPRPNGITADLHVCEHPTPVAELRRIHDTVSESLGFRTLAWQEGDDVWQLHVMLHALGYFREATDSIPYGDPTMRAYTAESVEAVEAFREDQGMSTAENGSPAGLVDAAAVAALWAALEERGLVDEVRGRFRRVVGVRR